jgi:hypothetical protein
MPLESSTVLFLGQVSSPEQTLENYMFLLFTGFIIGTRYTATACAALGIGYRRALRKKCREQERMHDQIDIASRNM